jgi:hypothetical protein
MPVTTNNRRIHRDTHHRCTRMYVQTVQSSTCLQVQSGLLKASTTNLSGRPDCDTRPLRRDMSFATGVDKVAVLTQIASHLPL